MNPRERFVSTILFEQPDKIPFAPGGPRESTIANWHKQGLPEGANWMEHLLSELGIDPEAAKGPVPLDVNFQIIPQFEEKVIERREGTLVVQDWKGNVCEISDEFDVTYLRSARDFVTRKWIKCPVETRDDWQQMKLRYDANDLARFPADFAERCKKLKDRDFPLGLHFSGPFWELREWMGFENLCMAFIEAPELVQDMLDFYREFCSAMMERVFSHITPDYVWINEDMAYKVKAMISPEMTRQYLVPVWKEWGELIHGSGCPIFSVDSDGFIGELIPIWIEAGFQSNDPVEVAAGNDLQAFRNEFGRKMAFRGGVDKREMAKGGDSIKAEMERLAPVIASGGYIPGCDHGIPSDVSWPAMLEYSRLLAKATGWL
jgi:uroporphyrinogen decarboxylase